MKDEILDITKDLIDLITAIVTLASAIVSYLTIKSTKKKRKKK